MIAAGIEYVEAGAGPPVVCLHGIGGDTENFRPQLDGLTRHRVIAWNMPGYGASRRLPQPPSFASLSGALAGLLDALGLGRVHLLGHSIGGMLALDHAIRRPDQVASLSLIGTTGRFGGRDDSFREAFLAARLKPLDEGRTMAEIAESAAPGLVGRNADAACIASVAGSLARVPERTWREILACLVTFERQADLPGLTQPVCLISGSDDTNAPARTMRRMAEAIPGAEYHEIDGAGHFPQLEAPGQVNGILQSFLARHPA